MDYCVSIELYEEVAARLQDAIDGGNYYSGTLNFLFGEIEWRFTASLIVYRERCERPEGVEYPITNLVPVWWEFHTVGDQGEMLNDFELTALKCYICLL